MNLQRMVPCLTALLTITAALLGIETLLSANTIVTEKNLPGQNQPRSDSRFAAHTIALTLPFTSTSYIDDPILITASVSLTPSLVFGDEMVFDFADIPLVQGGLYNDFQMTYASPDTCDRDAWVYNHKTNTWDQISFQPPLGTPCLQMVSTHSHLFSAQGLKSLDYVNAESQVRLFGPPKLPVN